VRPGARRVLPFAGQAHLRAGRGVLLCRLLDQGSRQGLEARVGREANGVIKVLALAIVVERRDGKAAVSTQLDPHGRPATTHGGDEAAEDGDHAVAGVHGPVTQDSGDKVVGVPVEDQQRMVPVLAVIAVVAAPLLLAVSWIVGAVQIEEHVVRHAAALAFLQVDGNQGLGQPVTRPSVDRILQARERGLARQVGAVLGQAPAHEFEERIVPQGVGVILIFIAASDL